MTIRYFSHQDQHDPMNGQKIEQRVHLSELLHSRRSNAPFIAEMTGDNGFQLTAGIGASLCCVQHSLADGSQPYLMAVSPHRPISRGCVEFLSANTLTPIAARYVISFDELEKIALHFFDTGERSDIVAWQELDPRALVEDTVAAQAGN